jgi:hypothetical protein
MDQLAENNVVKNHLLDEKGGLSELIDPISANDDILNATATTAQPYRLYKRRWIGVFAMVSTSFPTTYPA